MADDKRKVNKEQAKEEQEFYEKLVQATDELLSQGLEEYPHIYSDGSYDKKTDHYGYATIIIFPDGRDPYIRYGKGTHGVDNGWQVNGEVAGVMLGLQALADAGYKHMVVNYDLKNIELWANGVWQAKKTYSIRYREYVSKLRSQGIEILFEKVKSHSGDKYNEWADYYAKKGLGITKHDNLDAM